MTKALSILSCSILILALLFPSIQAKDSKTESYDPKVESTAAFQSDRHLAQKAQTSSAYIDTFVLAEYTFDSMGGPDPQGWFGVDRTVQDTFFHIDNFAGLSGGYGPLEGVQSVWCGARPDPVYCDYATLPGYGNAWDERFESVSFASTGDVTLDCLVKYDSEADYDYTYLEYLHKNGYWVRIDSVHGQNEKLWSGVAPADSLNNEVKFRFRFKSDGAWSDQDGLYNSDGAVIIDSLTVSDTTGVLDYQDFESESVGDGVTSDGDWAAAIHAPFGDYTGLFSGTTVLQEDTVWTNLTYLWGFFNGSPDNYSCGGHPEQLVVPFTRNPGSKDPKDYIHNEIWSPWIDLNYDINGKPVPWDASSLIYEFDVYRDLPNDNIVYYTYRIRSLVDGCPSWWYKRDEFYYGPHKNWFHTVAEFWDLVRPGATHVQLALSVKDWCALWCGVYGTGACHSHAPLFDNVKLSRVYESAAGAEPAPAVENYLAQSYPNPFNPTTTILFSIRERAHVAIKVYNSAGLLVRTLVNEVRDAGEYTDVTWDGLSEEGNSVSSGVYFYRLVTKDFSQTRKAVLLK